MKSRGKARLKEHEVKHETETPGVLKCIFWGCKQTFTSATDLREHTAKHWDFSKSEERPFICDVPECNLAFKSQRYLRFHKNRVHKVDASSVCHICCKQFRNILYLTRHIKRQHENQQSEEVNDPTVQQLPKITEERQTIVCKDEIEEVVFE
jgi:uncharacterized Zn-finger protein